MTRRSKIQKKNTADLKRVIPEAEQKNYVSASKNADWYDTWMTQALHRCMWTKNWTTFSNIRSNFLSQASFIFVVLHLLFGENLRILGVSFFWSELSINSLIELRRKPVTVCKRKHSLCQSCHFRLRRFTAQCLKDLHCNQSKSKNYPPARFQNQNTSIINMNFWDALVHFLQQLFKRCALPEREKKHHQPNASRGHFWPFKIDELTLMMPKHASSEKNGHKPVSKHILLFNKML